MRSAPARRGLKRGLPAMLLTIAHWLAAKHFIVLMEVGGNAWVSLLVLWAGWNATKSLMIGPISLVLLVCVRVDEATVRHRVPARARRQREEDTRLRV